MVKYGKIIKCPTLRRSAKECSFGIVGLYGKIGVLREQLRLAKEQAATNESIQSEIERFMKAIQEYSGDSFTEYDDTIVRRLIECIKVSPDRTIEIILKGGIHGKEKV